MERRTSPRQPIELEAKLEIQGQGEWPCMLADFCAEGVFIKYDADQSIPIKETIRQLSDKKVFVHFTQKRTGQVHHIQVRPLRVIDNAMGGCFIDVNVQAVNALLEEATSDNLHPPKLDHSQTQLEFMMHQCSRVMTVHLSELMDTFFESLTEQLESLANRASNDQLANAYMDSLSIFQKRRQGIVRLFLSGIEQPIQNKQKKERVSDQEPLSLVEKNEFEDWLTAKVMIAKAESQYREWLLQLKMRLDKVGLVNETGYQNPLGPALVVYAFTDALAQLSFTRQVEKAILRVFENSVLKHIENMYVEINNILIRNNILPDLDLTKFMSLSNAESKESPTKLKEKIKEETSKTETEQLSKLEQPKTQENLPLEAKKIPFSSSVPGFSDHQAAARKAYSNLTQLFAKLKGQQSQQQNNGAVLNSDNADKRGVSTKSQIGESQVEVSTEEFSSTLEAIKAENTGAEPEIFDEYTPTLTAKIQHSLSAAGSDKKVLPPKQKETLDVVDRFFMSMRKSAKLSDKAKAQLKQLEVPVFKSLLKDASLFEQEQSPIRAVINRIAQLGLRGGRPNESQTRKVTALVARVNTEAEEDPRVFDEVLAELDELIDRQNLLYRKNVERVTSAAEGAQKVAQAKRRVNLEIESRVAGKRVPKAVMTLINSGWRDLLSLTLIRQGEESSDWTDYLGVLDQLLTYAENRAIPINLSELLRLIKDGLSSISMNNTPSGHIRDELKKFLISKSVPEMIDVSVSPPPAEEAELEPLKDSRKRSLKRWLERVQKLQEGDWLKNQKDPENINFMRLVWLGNHDNRYIFVNHQGMKVIDLTTMQLAAWMQKGWLEMAHDYGQSVVDESLDNMVRDVYEQLSFATAHDPLTGLLNRKEFIRSTDICIANAKARDHLILMHLDLRHFRTVNEEGGYEAGDALLKCAADILKEIESACLHVGRLGANEFGVMLEKNKVNTIGHALIDRMRRVSVEKDNRRFSVGLSVGAAELSDVVNSSGALIAGAERACRIAKESGIDQLGWFQPPLPDRKQQQRVNEQLETLQNTSTENLDSHAILLKSQKIIPLHGNTHWGAYHDIHVSLYDQKGGLIPVKDMVTLAERKNRIQALDRWMVSFMLKWMQDHAAQVETMGGVSIGLSGRSLNDASLIEDIFDKMSRSDAPLDKLWFDINEASAISNLHDVADFITEMKEIGCHFCLGNFGKGDYTYHFLRSLPVDTIKIDGSFIKELARDKNDQAMVKSMAEMVHFMDKELIAEQVEDKATLDFLISLGIDYAQGHYIERPKLIIDT